MDLFLQQLLLDPVSVPFMQRALLAVALTGIVCGVVGAYVVTRGMAFLGDAMAHAIVPGVALSYIASGGAMSAVTLGGLGAAVFAAVFIGWLTRGRRLSEDTAIGVVFAGMLALGIAIISTTRNYSTDLTHLLIGNVLAVTPEDVALIAVVTLAVLGIVLLFYKELLIILVRPDARPRAEAPGRRTAPAVARAAGGNRRDQPANGRCGAGRVAAGDAGGNRSLLCAAAAYADDPVGADRRARQRARHVCDLAPAHRAERRHRADAHGDLLLVFLFAPRGGFIWGVLRRAPAGP